MLLFSVSLIFGLLFAVLFFSVFGFVGLTRGKKVSVLSIISAPALRLFGLMYLPPKAGPRPFPFGIVIFNERSRG